MQKTVWRLGRGVARFWKRSNYARPLLIFFILLVLCAVLVLFFEEGSNGNEFTSFLDGIWWVVITFSTTGYGDKVPITLGGRIVAITTVLVGIVGVSLLSGGLASWLIERNTRARRGLVDYSKEKNHLVICGWKNDMRDIVYNIIITSQNVQAENIVIVADVGVETFEQLQEDEDLRGIKFVRGEYFSVPELKRAGLQQARKVLVLADNTGGTSVTEVDSKTVLTVLTIKSIAREVYVVAELLDKKFESYLRYVHCDEILFSRDVSRRMLANTSTVNGMSHILYELLNQDTTKCRLLTLDIPNDYVNKPFSDYEAYLRSWNNVSRLILLGVLENSGNPARLKIESLREAQKTADISKLVSNLREVKGIELNKPFLIPPSDYIIQHNSKAIVLASPQEIATHSWMT